ncbi:ankyrin repeat domain-containing protein 28 [Colletotrichum truncatum]|uniref:Ankyrin repeat domain-containing protein 28 n=1 Tax=Colletotrichum truncatum TaxID=5467 RepID=A0ACC3YFJ0_COLTU|nr:ankyrin repeat domain-containing protein 28 [Colletotrichum truncatum]KAF6790177.1 ankyrin repeat domain-containing protein 28 [Colletotrichum truncatum]
MPCKHFFFALALFVLCSSAADDGLSDFTNDLATDLGPLLALFGEFMTKQYLSESTTFLDYFIFAMCPIGIITTIVSVIRVCGSQSLRVFIGRSYEGNGVVEAELCTSTSRYVCELFDHGGITRVLGRPKILELV